LCSTDRSVARINEKAPRLFTWGLRSSVGNEICEVLL
jgi:hypothetical protein